MMLPSKELLSEVLCMYGINLIIFDENTNEINYTTFASIARGIRDENINIYELAHKCKEWAWKNDYSLHSEPVPDKWNCSTSNAGIIINEYFIADTEPEAIFKACQWILDNKDKQ